MFDPAQAEVRRPLCTTVVLCGRLRKTRPKLYHLHVLLELRHFIRTHALFHPGDRVSVAVSGGADSVALLRALLDLRSELGIVLSVVHLHHGIRGDEADTDEQFVAHLAKQFELPLHLDRADVPAHSRESKQSLETSARDVRYAFFRRLLESNACDKIATAHTQDDQAETVLLRILRGTGTHGLAAIPPMRNASAELAARIVRPLLATRRSEIEAYLTSLNQPWREDSTNTDPKHLRNRIRHELLPQLEADYNPQLRSVLTSLADIARTEEEYWAALVDAQLRESITITDAGAELSKAKLTAIPLALQRRVLVGLFDHLDLPMDFDAVTLLLECLHGHRAGELSLTQATVHAGRDEIRISRRIKPALPSVTGGYDLPLPVPSDLTLPNSAQLRATLVSREEAASYNPTTLLAYDRLQLPLRVRNWQPGDRFWPAGSKQPEKLKRLFQEHHIPANARASWPVVLSGDNIVWVREFPVAHGFQAGQQRAVRIEILESRNV